MNQLVIIGRGTRAHDSATFMMTRSILVNTDSLQGKKISFQAASSAVTEELVRMIITSLYGLICSKLDWTNPGTIVLSFV